MSHCQYHPIAEAHFNCQTCQVDFCADCVDDGVKELPMCFLCQLQLTALKTSNKITPFWRRLEKSFRYPLTLDSGLLIVGMAVLTFLSRYLPLSYLLTLFLTTALFRYCFSCLENTSKGNMLAPSVTDAYGGGIKLALLLFLMTAIVFGLMYASMLYLGPMIGSFVSFILIVTLPAMIINFAITDSLIGALNPQNNYKLITSVGLPYGLLLGFILIMSGSVGVINGLIGDYFSAVSTILELIVSYYYLIVIFHIMGYMIYQFQDDLDYVINDVYTDPVVKRSKAQRIIAQIDVLIKEGEYEKVLDLYQEIMQLESSNAELQNNYMELLLTTKNIEKLEDFTPKILSQLIKNGRKDKAVLVLTRLYSMYPKFSLDDASVRYDLASYSSINGKYNLVIKLVNGLHKMDASLPLEQLIESFQLMSNALKQLPNREKQVLACDKLIKQLKAKSATQNHC